MDGRVVVGGGGPFFAGGRSGLDLSRQSQSAINLPPQSARQGKEEFVAAVKWTTWVERAGNGEV